MRPSRRQLQPFTRGWSAGRPSLTVLLIALHADEREARLGALRAFIITGGGGLCLLAGAALVAVRTGTWSLAELTARAPEVVADPMHIPALLLMLLGAFAKSAQFPLHAWLPGAMAAPAPVSAYLHSATMVKAGILLLGRLFPIFATSPLWLPVLVAVGLLTLLVALGRRVWRGPHPIGIEQEKVAAASWLILDRQDQVRAKGNA